MRPMQNACLLDLIIKGGRNDVILSDKAGKKGICLRHTGMHVGFAALAHHTTVHPAHRQEAALPVSPAALPDNLPPRHAPLHPCCACAAFPPRRTASWQRTRSRPYRRRPACKKKGQNRSGPVESDAQRRSSTKAWRAPASESLLRAAAEGHVRPLATALCLQPGCQRHRPPSLCSHWPVLCLEGA